MGQISGQVQICASGGTYSKAEFASRFFERAFDCRPLGLVCSVNEAYTGSILVERRQSKVPLFLFYLGLVKGMRDRNHDSRTISSIFTGSSSMIDISKYTEGLLHDGSGAFCYREDTKGVVSRWRGVNEG